MVIRGRYELDFSKPPIGEGAMGVVYRAVDLNLDHCPVAVKTVKDISNPTILELFDREWKSIAKIHHDNIVRIVDQGRFDDRGISRPFIVMEFLDGVTLDQLIRNSSSRLTVENSLDIIYQVCSGLEKIHAANLVHRDLKPGNIFVTKDNRVKIIDFGLAHLVRGIDGTSIKGTPLYMAPEQFDGKEPTALSDQFALGVVTYETLTRQRPFGGESDGEIRLSICRDTPLPASQINPEISPLIGCVIHKALAKKEQQRFPSVAVFVETLRKAAQGGPIEIFNLAGMRDRLERARDYFKAQELDLASKTLGAIEAEGYYDEEIKVLRGQIKLRERQRGVSQRLETARAHMDAAEYPLALEEIEAALEIDPQSLEARSLQKTVESRSREIKAEKWYQLAEKHFEDQLYPKASEAVQQILKLQPNDQGALDLRVRIERAQRDEASIRSQRRSYYEQAVAAFQSGDIESAFSKMESLFRLGQPSGGKTPLDSDSTYERFFQEIRTAQDELVRAYNDGRRNLAEKNYREAIRICTDLLEHYPGNAQLKALRVDAEDQEQRDLSAFIAEVGRRVEAERDLDKKVKILEEAVSAYPEEVHFQNKLKITRYRRDMVQSVLDEKAVLEKQANFAGALSRLKALQQVYAEFPGLERDMAKLEQRLQEQHEEERKAEWERQIQHELDTGDWRRAGELLGRAQEEFKDDAGLKAIEALISKVKIWVEGAWQLLADGKALIDEHNIEAGLETLKRAREQRVQDLHFLAALSSVYLDAAEQIYEHNWKLAERLIEESLQCDPANLNAKELTSTLRERKRRDVVTQCLTQAREVEANGRIEDAVQTVEKVLGEYPDEIRLQQLRDRYLRLRPDLTPKPASPEGPPSEPPAESAAVPNPSLPAVAVAPVRVEPMKRNGRVSPTAPTLEQAGIVQRKPASKSDSVEKWKTALNGRMLQIAAGGGAFLGVVLLIWVIVHHKPVPSAPSANLAAVDVKNVTAGGYKIFDTLKNADVTTQASQGLPAGNYKLSASRPGFHDVEQSFTVDPSQGSSKTLVATWEALPAELTFKMAQGLGSLKVDNEPKPLDSNSEFKAEWSNGSHSLVWDTPTGDSVQVQFEVKDDTVEMKHPQFHGSGFVGIAAALSRGEVAYQTMYTGGLIVDGQPELHDPAGTFAMGNLTAVNFKAKSGRFPLGEFRAGQSGQPVIYVYLAPHQQPSAPAPTPTKLAMLVVKNAALGEYQIIDGAGTDVTSLSSGGLPAGTYKLVASRAGFRKVERSFTMDPLKEPTTTIELVWEKLPPVPDEHFKFCIEKLHPGHPELCK